MLDPNLISRAKAVDLLVLAGRYTALKKVALTDGGEYAGPCPLCGGRDRFRVQPKRGRWLCRHCTDRWEDAIALEMRLSHSNFVEAVQSLAGGAWPQTIVTPHTFEPCTEPPNAQWQARVQSLIQQASHNLWSPSGQLARAWLNARGLSDATLHQWRIGYLSKSRREPAERWGLTGDGVYIASGILIPGEIADIVWYLKVRRLGLHADPKYLQVRGGRPALYLAGTLADATTVCATEGEFDALLLWQCLQRETELRQLAVVTLGSQTNRLRQQWADVLTGKRLCSSLTRTNPASAALRTGSCAMLMPAMYAGPRFGQWTKTSPTITSAAATCANWCAPRCNPLCFQPTVVPATTPNRGGPSPGRLLFSLWSSMMTRYRFFVFMSMLMLTVCGSTPIHADPLPPPRRAAIGSYAADLFTGYIAGEPMPPQGLPLRGPLSYKGELIVQPVLGCRFDDEHYRGHRGADFPADSGTPVYATLSGLVVWAGERRGGWGNVVVVENYGYQTWFAHLSAVQVARGDVVNVGDVVGAVGSTGNSTAPHLHYGIWKKVDVPGQAPARWLDPESSFALDAVAARACW